VAVPVPDLDQILEQTQWDFFWAPADAEVVDRPELLYVRCPRDAPHLNAVTRVRAAPAALPALIEEVLAAHAGVRSRWMVVERQESAPLERALGRYGYAPVNETHASAIAVDDYRPRSAQGIEVRRVETLEGLRHCVAVIERTFPGSRRITEEELALDLSMCTGPAARVQRYVAHDVGRGEPVASGGLTLFPALRFGFLWSGGTVPGARGRGAYSAVMAARVARAREVGLTHVGLYAFTDTSAPIVARQGFTRHGAMTFWERDP
jgi:hypothetical protein